MEGNLLMYSVIVNDMVKQTQSYKFYFFFEIV